MREKTRAARDYELAMIREQNAPPQFTKAASTGQVDGTTEDTSAPTAALNRAATVQRKSINADTTLPATGSSSSRPSSPCQFPLLLMCLSHHIHLHIQRKHFRHSVLCCTRREDF